MLKLLPNLKILILESLGYVEDRNHQQLSPLNFSELTKLIMLNNPNSFRPIIENLRCSTITEIEIDLISPDIMLLIQLQANTLVHLLIDLDDNINCSALIGSLNETTLNFLKLSHVRVDPPVFERFLRSQKNLLHLELSYVHLTNQHLNVIFNVSQELEVLKLTKFIISEDPVLDVDFNDLARLRHLRSLTIFEPALEYTVLGSLRFGIFEALKELKIFSVNQSDEEFFNELGRAIPNLKKLTMGTCYGNADIMSDFLTAFKNLENLELEFDFEDESTSKFFWNMKYHSRLQTVLFVDHEFRDGLCLKVDYVRDV
jgi:hypothetical protein